MIIIVIQSINAPCVQQPLGSSYSNQSWGSDTLQATHCIRIHSTNKTEYVCST